MQNLYGLFLRGNKMTMKHSVYTYHMRIDRSTQTTIRIMNMHDVINASQKRSASILGAKKPTPGHDNDDNDDDAVDYNRTIRPLWPSRDDTALPLQNRRLMLNRCDSHVAKNPHHTLYGMNWKRPVDALASWKWGYSVDTIDTGRSWSYKFHKSIGIRGGRRQRRPPPSRGVQDTTLAACCSLVCSRVDAFVWINVDMNVYSWFFCMFCFCMFCSRCRRRTMKALRRPSRKSLLDFETFSFVSYERRVVYYLCICRLFSCNEIWGGFRSAF